MIWSLVLLAVAVSISRTSRRKPPAPVPSPGTAVVPGEPVPSRREQQLAGLRDRYVADDLTLDEFETEIADALEHPSPEPAYTSHTEIPRARPTPGAELHIHLS